MSYGDIQEQVVLGPYETYNEARYKAILKKIVMTTEFGIGNEKSAVRVLQLVAQYAKDGLKIAG